MAKKRAYHIRSNQTTTVNGVTQPKLPTINDINVGELAINYKDGFETLSIRNDNDEIVTFATLEQLQAYIENEAKLSENYQTSALTGDALALAAGDNLDTFAGKLEKQIEENELVISSALNDLNSQITNLSLPDDYEKSSLPDGQLDLNPGDSYNNAFSKLEAQLESDGLVTSAALNDLNSRVTDVENNPPKLSSNYQTSTLVNSDLRLQPGENLDTFAGKLEKAILDDETITAAALNDLNTRKADLTELENYVTTSDLALKQDILVSGTNIKTINNESLLGSGNIIIQGASDGEANVIEGVTFNGTTAPITDKIAAITYTPDLSSCVKTTGDQSISGIKTFSSEVRMTAGGTSDISRGVLASFKTNRAQITNLITHNIYTGGTNSTTPITFYKYGSVFGQAPTTLTQLAKIDTDGNIYEGTTKLSDKYLTSYTETDPTVPAAVKAITATDISSWNNKVSNVQADWNATSGLAQILNKPTIPTALADLTADSTHRLVTDTEKSTWNSKANTSDLNNYMLATNGTHKGKLTFQDSAGHTSNNYIQVSYNETDQASVASAHFSGGTFTFDDWYGGDTMQTKISGGVLSTNQTITGVGLLAKNSGDQSTTKVWNTNGGMTDLTTIYSGSSAPSSSLGSNGDIYIKTS